jgi:hypothetical protein
MNLSPTQSSPISRLQRFAKPEAPQKRCDLCGAPIHADDHAHLLDVKSRQLTCSCAPCAILFTSDPSGAHRRVPDRVRLLPDLNVSDEVWESLHVPINLAFFYHNAAAGKIVAMYPSPAGAMESLLPIDAWADLTAACPDLRNMQSDVEALLANRIGRRRDALLVPIDACFKLVGIIRTNWRGLSGGTEVWQHVEKFFDDLYRRAGAQPGGTNA